MRESLEDLFRLQDEERLPEGDDFLPGADDEGEPLSLEERRRLRRWAERQKIERDRAAAFALAAKWLEDRS